MAQDLGEEYIIEAEIPLLRAKDDHWFQEPVYIGKAESGNVRLAAKIFCAELGAPREQELELFFQVGQQELTIEELLSSAEADLRMSGEYRLAREVARLK